MMSLTRRGALTLLGSAALSAPFVRRARAEGTLNAYNWADYIGETTLEDFQSATGIAVNYDNFSSVEEMQAKMLAGSSGYDVVLQTGTQLPVMLGAGVYEPLDKAQLPGWGNLDPKVLSILADWDPGNAYALPYMWGSVGFAFNTAMVKERLPGIDFETLDFLFDPASAAKLADCGISVLDTPADVMGLVLKHLGRDPDAATQADYDAVAAAFAKVRADIRTFDNTLYTSTLPAGDLCVANTWSGNFGAAKARAAEAGLDVDLSYAVPRTGAPIWIDCWCIPKDAPNKANAFRFLDYLLQPKVIAGCTNFTSYANANAKALPFVDAAIAANPALYPDAATMARLYAPKAPSPEQLQMMIGAWTRIKTG